MMPRIGSLFSGYGGLDMGTQAVLGGETVWVSDVDKGANKILAHRFPDVPNLGDITTVDWSQVERVDVLTGGSPCQDLSHAGKRAGMTDGTRSNLWVAMREAIAHLRPGLVVWENVRGAYSAEADSDLEFCAGCMGEAQHRGTVLRALGRVLGDLSDLGYVGGWHGLRAADVGAPHGRFRVFVVATDAQRGGRDGWTPDPFGGPLGRVAPAGSSQGPRLLKTPTSQLAVNGGSQHPDKRKAGGHGPTLADEVEHLLPTPAVNDMGAAYTPDEWDAWTDRMKAEHGNGNGHGKSLSVEAARLLPTPRVGADRTGRSAAVRRDSMSAPSLSQAIEISKGELPREFNSWDELPPSWQPPGDLGIEAAWMVREESAFGVRWGDYAAAVTRWEALTRPAPAPTMTSTKGNPQLAPAFVEWMMGLPAGWVTDVPGISRNEALKALGNGVVPQQAEAALRFLLARVEVAA